MTGSMGARRQGRSDPLMPPDTGQIPHDDGQAGKREPPGAATSPAWRRPSRRPTRASGRIIGGGPPEPRARALEFVPDAFVVHLEDGRSLTVPLVEWFPRLRDATPEQRLHYEMIGHGLAIHWPDIDEDISVPRLFGLPC